MSRDVQTAWIIDDDEIYKYGFRKYVTIKKFCPNILEFANGEEAISYLKSPINQANLPDIIFLDIDMPVMDGWGFVDAFSDLKSRLDKQITLLMVTSSLNYADIVRARRCPEITEYIVKPIDAEQFTAAFNFGQNKLSA
ncbi:response regulator [Mucilaginibacter sp. UYCu711]|uniref:response regulator n=1 Tax=Mucilaginibacter sp. UYCu711 TaxID=3156339 RepID=UPI003D1EE2C9